MARRLHPFPGSGISLLAGASASQALPPAAPGYVASWIQDGVAAEFDLELWADGARALTGAVLYGGHQHDLTFADLTVTADNTTELFAATGHGKQTGDGPVMLTTTGTFPGGTDGVTQYWIREGADADHFKLAPTLADALAGTNLIDLTSNGTGTIKLVAVASTTQRLYWHSHGFLGLNDDGEINLTSRDAYMVRCRHSARALAYCVVATFGAGAGAVSARVYPVYEK